MPSVTRYPLLLLAVLWLLTVGAFGVGYHWQTRTADARQAEAAQAHEIERLTTQLAQKEQYQNEAARIIDWEADANRAHVQMESSEEIPSADETKQWKMTLVGDYFHLLELFAAWEGHPHATEITLMKMAPISPSVCRAEILVRQTAPVKTAH